MFGPSFKGFHEGQSGFPFIPEGFSTVQRKHKDHKEMGERESKERERMPVMEINHNGQFK